MNQALNLAKCAAKNDDVPVGAVIVKEGKVIARGKNQIQLRKNPILHAEIIAIQKACKKLGEKFLCGCDIYISLEPCAMCASAISFARINKIYFAAKDEKGGAIFHNSRIYESDKHLWRPKVEQLPEFEPESAKLLRDFFAKQRKNKKRPVLFY